MVITLELFNRLESAILDNEDLEIVIRSFDVGRDELSVALFELSLTHCHVPSLRLAMKLGLELNRNDLLDIYERCIDDNEYDKLVEYTIRHKYKPPLNEDELRKWLCRITKLSEKSLLYLFKLAPTSQSVYIDLNAYLGHVSVVRHLFNGRRGATDYVKTVQYLRYAAPAETVLNDILRDLGYDRRERFKADKYAQNGACIPRRPTRAEVDALRIGRALYHDLVHENDVTHYIGMYSS